jgi:hypothetical protein
VAITVQIDGLAELRAAAARSESTLLTSLDDGLEESARIVAKRYAQIAPKVTGRMARSAQPFTEGAVAGVRVTATRSSRKYPRFLYPALLEASRGILRHAVEAEAPEVGKRMEKVLDDVERQWGGA